VIDFLQGLFLGIAVGISCATAALLSWNTRSKMKLIAELREENDQRVRQVAVAYAQHLQALAVAFNEMEELFRNAIGKHLGIPPRKDGPSA